MYIDITCSVAVFMQTGNGKLVVMGSGHMFSDQYLDKEENAKMQDIVFQLLTTDDIMLNPIDADNPEVSMYMGRILQLICASYILCQG